MNKIKNYGFSEKDVCIRPEDFIFGAHLEQTVIRPDGQWDDILTQYESQARNFETWGCVPYATTSQIELYHRGVFGTEPNYSERYLYNIMEIEPPGSNPNDAYQAIRHNGLVKQEILPMVNTLEEFKKPRPMEQKYKDEGLQWGYILQHEWISSSDMKSAIIDALKYNPVALSVTAWRKEGEFYVDDGQPNTHWTLAYGWGTTPEGKTYLKIFDSYDFNGGEFLKKLHPDHHIGFAKRILLTKQLAVNIQKISLITRILNLMYQLLEALKAKAGYGII